MVYLTDSAGKTRTCPTGFSWTTLFFGPLVPLMRGWFAMVPVYLGGSFLTFGIFAFVIPFQINRYWISYLLDQGFAPATGADARMLASLGLPDANLPRWAANRVKTYRCGEAVPYGLYVALNGFDYRFVGEEGAGLEGLAQAEYIRMPMLVTLALLPVLGAAFYFAFPAIVIGFSLFAAYKLAVKPLRAFFAQKAHLAELHWNPVMAHMKHPKDAKKADAQTAQNKTPNAPKE